MGCAIGNIVFYDDDIGGLHCLSITEFTYVTDEDYYYAYDDLGNKWQVSPESHDFVSTKYNLIVMDLFEHHYSLLSNVHMFKSENVEDDDDDDNTASEIIGKVLLNGEDTCYITAIGITDLTLVEDNKEIAFYDTCGDEWIVVEESYDRIAKKFMTIVTTLFTKGYYTDRDLYVYRVPTNSDDEEKEETD